jgi:hypothetical protein
MSALLAVDTGAKECGIALFAGAQLQQCAMWCRDDFESWRSPMEWSFICERPRVYGGRAKVGDTQDLLDVSFVAGALVAVARVRGATNSRAVFPQEWKGSVPKQIMCRRIYARLYLKEQHVLKDALPNSEIHKLNGTRGGELSKRTTDLLDAVGIGLWELGRLKKGRSK